MTCCSIETWCNDWRPSFCTAFMRRMNVLWWTPSSVQKHLGCLESSSFTHISPVRTDVWYGILQACLALCLSWIMCMIWTETLAIQRTARACGVSTCGCHTTCLSCCCSSGSSSCWLCWSHTVCTRIRGRRTYLPVILLRIRHSAEKKEGGQATVTVRDKTARAS